MSKIICVKSETQGTCKLFLCVLDIAFTDFILCAKNGDPFI